jgi:biopolymer transport protein ExbB/TolQ
MEYIINFFYDKTFIFGAVLTTFLVGLYKIKIYQAKKQGENNFKSLISQENNKKLSQQIVEREKTQNEMHQIVDTIVDTWADVAKLRSQGKRKLHEFANPKLRKNARKIKK